MSDYRKIKVRNGFRYLYNNRLVKKESVPVSVLEQLETQDTVPEPVTETVTQEIQPEVDKSCIFCGQHSTSSRFINLQTIFICEEHYYTTNVGQIAQKMRERETANA